VKARKAPWWVKFGHAITGAFTRNLGLKAVCLCGALLVVAYQRSSSDEKTRTIAFTVDAQLPQDDIGRELMTPLPPNIKVTLKGSTNALDELAAKSPSVDIDLRDGRSSHSFTAEQLQIPAGVAVKYIEPSSIDLEWQTLINRPIPIQSSVTGQVADGHEVAGLSVEPQTVDLRGPASLVRVTQVVRAAPFDITGLSAGTYQRQLALDPAPNRTHYLAHTSATVTVEIRRRLVTVSFPRTPVEVVGIAGAKVIPARVDVTVKGTPEVVGALQPELVVARVDISKVDTTKHGSGVFPVVVDLAHATSEVQPPTVKVSY
jgi:YbbR domain-containing protein